MLFGLGPRSTYMGLIPIRAHGKHARLLRMCLLRTNRDHDEPQLFSAKGPVFPYLVREPKTRNQAAVFAAVSIAYRLS